MINFHHKQYEWKQLKCEICHEIWPVRQKTYNVTYRCFRCNRDKHEPKLYSSLNNAIPQSQPPCLQNLTQIEEMLIARVSPIMYIYKKQGGQRGYKGHILNLSQDIQSILDKLPPRVSDLPVIILRRKGDNDTYSGFTVRRQHVLNALLWLK